ncbi:MAG: TIGR04168 family protein [Oscillatoriophycideae cyanobacterium NC_groundwater_1537_Pr4_S-0.65um_50_18]|nr:TIGR04168 family protein [Oscillatoriophycideae cyanobacterium NC_groundwater_1537_Pr4_S-0.65um_50_18]
MVSNSLSAEVAPIKIAVVGDVHDLWDSQDEAALQHLGVDLVLLVGDFGNESIAVVQAVANLDLPKAVILGNHDAWYTATDWGRKLRVFASEDGVQKQLDLLGDSHVGYGKLDFPALGLSVVGGRPFSWGGSSWKHGKFYKTRFGVDSFEESTTKIVEAADKATCDTVIFIGHCGPTGLGEAPEDLCGKDWKPIGGDHGDPDLREAIAQTRAKGRQVPLVAFGHMHHSLRHTKDRLRQMSAVEDGTVYLNAASVPRIRETEQGKIRNFSLVTLEAGVVTYASLVWLNADFEIITETVLHQSSHPASQAVKSF